MRKSKFSSNALMTSRYTVLLQIWQSCSRMASRAQSNYTWMSVIEGTGFGILSISLDQDDPSMHGFLQPRVGVTRGWNKKEKEFVDVVDAGSILVWQTKR